MAAGSPAALAPGFRFHPSDEELVQYYLKRKVCGRAVAFDAIAEVDIYKKEPWELGDESKLKSRDMEWYFFSALDRKYGNGGRVNRATCQGYWKATGNDRSVLHGSRIVGMKKTLVFHSGRAPGGKRTNWIMHEYRLADDELQKALRDSYVVCRIFLKSEIGPPHKDRYAPFVEEEWDDDKTLLPRQGKSEAEAVVDGEACIKESDLEQDTQLPKKAPPGQSEPVKSSGNVLFLPQSERLEDCRIKCIVSKEPTTLFPNKRSRHDDPNPQHSSAFESSVTTQDHCTLTVTTKSSPPAIFGFPLVELNEKKENQIKKELVELNGKKESQIKKEISTTPSTTNITDPTAALPPSYLKYITFLEERVREMSAEKERLKADMIRTQAILNAYTSQIDLLDRGNED